MTDTEAAPRRAQRGRGFPTLPLDDAVEAVAIAGNYGSSHAEAAVAGYLGHQTTNSGAFKSKMASLKDWGLITRQDGRIELTDLANRIAHPSSDEAARRHVREAFFKEELFSDVYEHSAKGVELSLEFIANRAVSDLGVAARSKQNFAQSFARSVVAAGLGTVVGNSLRLNPPPDDQAAEGDAPPPTPEAGHVADGFAQPIPTKGVVVPADVERPPTLRQEWAVERGTLVLEARLDGALPASAFAQVGEVVSAVEKLVESLGPPESPDTDEDDAAE